MISSRVGEIIRKRRTDLGIGQRELAELSGNSQGYISDLENGKVKNPTIDTLINIAKALNMKSESLINAQEGFDNLIIEGRNGVVLDLNDLPPEARELVKNVIATVKNQYINKK